MDALAADGRTIHRRGRVGLASATLAGPSALPVFRDALSACDSRASLTDEVEGQSGDIRIDRAGEPVRSYRRQADLYLYVRGECDVVSCGAILKQITYGAPIHQSDDAPD